MSSVPAQPAAVSAPTGTPPRGSVPRSGSWVQPLSTGILAAVIGFASTFTILLQAFAAVGATPAQAASGLLVICLVQAALTVVFSLWWRMPISIVWSTPASALMIANGLPAGGYPAAVGAVFAAGVLLIAAGLWQPLGRAAAAIPISLAGAMLAGILFTLCLAPVRAMAEMPLTTAPVVLAWALAWRFARPYAVPVALLAAVVVVVLVTRLPPDAASHAVPSLAFTAPSFNLPVLGSLALPLFVVTMASQNVPGLAVLRTNGFRPPVGPILVGTGLGTLVTAVLGGPPANLAAITAALCAGPDAHSEPAKRFWATVVTGAVYVLLGLGAGLAAVLVAAAPPLLIQAVAGLALFGSFGGAMATALADERARVPAVVTFLVAASGVSVHGIGAAFWGLFAGGLLMALDALRRSPSP